MQQLVSKKMRKNEKSTTVFRMCNALQNYYTVVEKRGFARWVRERNIINKHQKLLPFFMPKSLENLYKCQAPKSDAKQFEKSSNMELKGSQPPAKMYQKRGLKKWWFSKRPTGIHPGPTQVLGSFKRPYARFLARYIWYEDKISQ